MAFRCLKLLAVIKNTNIVRHNLLTIATFRTEKLHQNITKDFKTEENLHYLDDPDTFGTLSRVKTHKEVLEDEGDIKEERYFRELPLPTQKLTTKQYADLIKQYIKHKRLKEAINVLEQRMLQEDRVKPENYIYNILIGACADVGYTKKAFKLFNDMKRRGLMPTGDTYTCLFEACSNSPWPSDGLKHARQLRDLMIEKGIEPNLTNYNAMIKAFGRCGDLAGAFKLVDEMVTKKIKIRVHTLNHLLQACISDKENGLRHAIIVWRKMLKLREKPNIYSFNLMLRCVKDCNLGTTKDIEEVIYMIQEENVLHNVKNNLMLTSPCTLNNDNMKMLTDHNINCTKVNNHDTVFVSEPLESIETHKENRSEDHDKVPDIDDVKMGEDVNKTLEKINKIDVIDKDDIHLELVGSIQNPKVERTVPNLLSKVINMGCVLALQEIQTLQDKFALVGGQEDFLKEMELYNIKPDIKTFTQMLPLIDETTQAENKLIDTMKSLDIKADIDFYNILIKKRCFRSDYGSAFDVKDIIEKENKLRKKRYPLKKKLRLKPNIMTYGVLALACETKVTAEKLLSKMREEQIKVNIVILSSLLRQGTAHSNFEYVSYILNVVKQENIPVNDVFLKHLQKFSENCRNVIRQKREDNAFVKSYKLFSKEYRTFLKEVNYEEALKPEHPWQQFKGVYPETVQRQPIVIEEPKRFYKRNRKYVPYAPKT